MKADTEPVTEWLRVWKNDEASYGDHYSWFCGMRWISWPEGEVELVGITQRITPEIWSAIMECLQQKGARRILSTSYPGGSKGKTRKVWIDVPSDFQELWRI